jgi:hypothetical protein
VNLLNNRSLNRSEWANRAKEEFGYPNSTVYRYIATLTDAGRVFFSKVTERYSLVQVPDEEQEDPTAEEPTEQQPELPAGDTE